MNLSNSDREFCQRVTCAGTHHAKYHTLEICRALLAEGVEGDFAECGVMAGAHPAVMEFALRAFPNDRRKIHLFDCFKGIPAIGPNDLPATSVLEGQSACSVEQVKRNLSDWGCDPNRFVFHEGLFETTLAEAARYVGPLALLRVDVDLYSSTKEVYDRLYGKVVKGGFVVDDDWGVTTQDSPPCRLAALLSIAKQLEPMPVPSDVPENPGTAYWRKR